MADVTGGAPPTNASPFDVPGDIKDVYDHFGDQTMFSRSTAASLPVSGNWPGRELLAEDTGAVWVWNGSWTIRSYPADYATWSYDSGREHPGFGNLLSYLITPAGVVLSGTVQRTSGNFASNDTIATLPVGARPNTTQYFVAHGGGAFICNVQVNADGRVFCKAAPTGSTPWLSLDGFTLRR